MTLGFSTLWPDGKTPTYFPEKILHPYDPEIRERFPDMIPKIHTFREGYRWRSCMDIHMVTGNRTKNRTQFNKVCALSRCISVQSAQVMLLKSGLYIAYWDGKELQFMNEAQRLLFAANDGFNSIDELIKWFFPQGLKSEKTKYEGQIIHWTKFQY